MNTKKLDILFIKPGSQKQLYGNLGSFDLTAIEPPLWAALLAAYLRDKGYGVAIVDAEVEQLDWKQTASRIKEMDPLLTLITVSGTNPSASTMNMVGAGAILKHLHKLAPNIKTAIFGLHPTALPERTLNEEKVDYVIAGEGFNTLPFLLEALKNQGALKKVPGLLYKESNQLHKTEPSLLVEDLDILPAPAWDLLPLKDYRAHNWHCFDDINNRQPYVSIYTSLGCPFKCSFCCINALFGKSTIRYRSPNNVIKEIEYLVNTHGVKNIKIIDEMFALKKSHVAQLCDLIIERGLDLNIWAYARVNTVNRQMLAHMKKAGINWVAYGFESGSKRVLDSVSKGYDLDAVEEVVKATREEGLYNCANFIFGLPEDDEQSMRETLDMAIEMNAEWANLYSTMAYPGSKLYHQAIEQNLPLPKHWQDYSQYSYDCLPLPTKYLTGQQVLQFRDDAFDTYFKGERYLKMMKERFGQATVDHINSMTKTNLKRRFREK